jgi:serine O-acetyltransferase
MSVLKNLMTTKQLESFNKNVKYIGILNTLGNPEHRITLKDKYEQWKEWKISTLEFLMYLNVYGNRSFMDLMQYPVMPWPIFDYSSSSIDINENNPNIITRIRLMKYTKKYGLEISTKAQINEGFYVGHPYNVTIAEGVVIGKNCNVHKGCTIGRETRGKRVGVPTIGDKVFVGINSTIVGNIKIGNDVMIAPNTFVNFDVPDHSIVIGNPAVIHYKEDATKLYIGWCN